MKDFKSHFKFNKQERSGIFFLLLLIILLQIGYFLFKNFSRGDQGEVLQVDQKMQAQIDALKKNVRQKDSVVIYPFNPNFITDYKGYTLGMSVEEIDRLHDFRKANKYVNSPEEFQQLTQVSDSLLDEISPFFKFPEWTKKNSRQYSVNSEQYLKNDKDSPSPMGLGENFSDLNSATVEDLKSIGGIGEKLSARIVKFRDRLGGFLVDEQLYHVYGLKPEVAERALKRFKVLSKPRPKSILVNEASVEELTKLIYINYDLASKIVDYRNTNGRIMTFNELAAIEGFPSEKLDIIQLYLSLN